jgi:hypothetical protein
MKAIPDAVNGSNFGKTIFSKYKGLIYNVEKIENIIIVNTIKPEMRAEMEILDIDSVCNLL